MAEISPTELSDRLRDGDDESEDVLVLDIRHRDEYDEWHVPDSVNIDIYDELTDDPETAKDALEDLPADREIVTVCTAGIVSQTAAEVLREMGYDASTLTDGMNGWSRVHRAPPSRPTSRGRSFKSLVRGRAVSRTC